MEEKRTFEEYYNSYYSQIYAYVLHKISDSYSAEDIAMEAFAAAWKKFDSFDPARATFKTWIYFIVNNRLKNHYRDRREADDIDDCSIETGSFEDDVVHMEYIFTMRNALAAALDTLPETQQKIVVEKYYNEKTSDQIALLLGITPVNVRVQLSRAVEKLRRYFDANNIIWEN